MDAPSTGTIFVVSFLGALFAFLVVVIGVYTYVALRLVPAVKTFIKQNGSRALFEQANLDPAEAMRNFGVTTEEAAAAIAGEMDGEAGDLHIIFTCEDHGRCVGCPRVLAQFEAILRHQGSFDEAERKCYERLKDLLASDVRLDGELESAWQKRIATRVVDALVREGCAKSIAQSVVWSRPKRDRATFADWMRAARSARSQLVIQDEENIA